MTDIIANRLYSYSSTFTANLDKAILDPAKDKRFNDSIRFL